jgi:hypothetical protein
VGAVFPGDSKFDSKYSVEIRAPDLVIGLPLEADESEMLAWGLPDAMRPDQGELLGIFDEHQHLVGKPV